MPWRGLRLNIVPKHLRVLRASACICVKCFLCRSATAADGMKLFLDNASRLCSCSVHVRRPQTSHPNPGARSASGRRRHAPPPRPRPQPRSQADRLRQATRRHGPAARRHPRLRLPRQTVRHRRYRRHPRPHHLWPAPGRDAGSQALQTRRARPGPHGSAHPPARHTRAGRRTGGRAAGRPARRPCPGPAPRPPPHRGRDRRGGASPPGRRRHRRYLLRSRHRARPPRSGVLGRNQSRPHGVWRQLRPLLQRPGEAAMGLLRLRRPLRPRMRPGSSTMPVPTTGPP